MKPKTITGIMTSLLLISMLTFAFNIQPLIVMSTTAWDGVPDDPTPAQAVWVEPKVTECLAVGETFVVDVLVNVTSPTSTAGTGMFGLEYKLFWDPTIVNLTSYTGHIPAGWDPPNGFLVRDDTTVAGRHWYSYTCLTGSPFTGVMSLCTYTFEVLDDGSSDLDLQDVKIVDDTALTFITDTTDPDTGTIDDGTYCPVAAQYELAITIVGSGTTDPTPGSHLYAENAVVSVDAIPDLGWMLNHWELDTVNVGDTDPYSVTMNTNHTLVAVFVETTLSYVYVDPADLVANPSEYFDVNITVKNSPDLVGFQFKLRWDKKVLGFPHGPPYTGDNELCNVTEGTFLSSAGSTVFTVSPNFHESSVLVGCHLESTVATPPSGNGTLATFRFLVVDSGVSNLTLYGVKLFNYATGGEVAGVTTDDGYFYTNKPFVDLFWNPVSPETGEVATFNASACWDPDGGNITQYSWSFGDGSPINKTAIPVINHTFATYNETGYLVTLTVTDDENDTWSKTQTLPMWHELVSIDIWPSIYLDYPWWFMDTRDRKIIPSEWVWIVGTIVNLGTYEEVFNVTMTAKHVDTNTTIALPWLWFENEAATPWSETNVMELLGTGPAGGSGWDLMFHWNTRLALPGLWELKLAANSVLGEVNIANNNVSLTVELLSYGELSGVKYIGAPWEWLSRDLSVSGVIDIEDLVVAVEAFGSTPASAKWNPFADFNNDGIIDIFDLVVIGVKFGETW